jgi:uncharacterized ion transporter superfamily protein YfcC
MKKRRDKKNNLKKIHKNYFKTLVLAIAIVLFWRGVWGLMDLYFFPNMLPLSFILSILIGLLILYSVKHSWELLE